MKILVEKILISQILSERGYIVKERGLIQVKGKGEMLTFYVLGRKISRSWRFGRTVSLQGNNSLAEVVYGMVRARKRRKTTKGKTSYKMK
jgi:adenylate cyclase 8